MYNDQYEEDEKAILHYEAPVEKDGDEEEVFGERRTEERMMGEEKSPTRDILKHRMRERGDLGFLKKGTLKGVDVPGVENRSDFGKPNFFEEEEDPQLGNSVVEQGERPIVDVVREFLTTNSTLSPEQRQGVARWIRRGKKSRERMAGVEMAKKERKQLRRGGKGTQGFQAEQAPLPEVAGEVTSTRRARSSTSDVGFDGIEHDNFDIDSTTQSAGDSAFRKIFHMLEDGGKKAQEELEIVVKDKGGKKTNLDVLQYTLATVSGLAFLLLVFLLAILLKRKLASKFKMFDEKSRCHFFPVRNTNLRDNVPCV